MVMSGSRSTGFAPLNQIGLSAHSACSPTGSLRVAARGDVWSSCSRERLAGGEGMAQVQVGDHVEVHNKFNGGWTAGFEIAEVTAHGYRVCRSSDGSLLPNVTGEADVRGATGLA